METLPDFRVLQPRTIAAANAARRRHPKSRFVAGGTDLMVNLRQGIGQPKALIDLRAIPELRRFEVTAEGLLIGAAVTLRELSEHAALRQRYPAIALAADAVAAPAHREAGTLGGNLCLDTRCVFYNQSHWWRQANGFCLKYQGATCHVAPTGSHCHAAYSGDLAPALLVHGAAAEISAPYCVHHIPLAELYRDDGAAHLRLAPDEFLIGVRVPADPWPSTYAKVRVRGSIDFPLAGVAIALRAKRGVVAGLRVALSGTNSRPFLLEGTDAFHGSAFDDAALDRLEKLVQKQVSPMRTTLIASQYRRRVAASLARKLVPELLSHPENCRAD